MDNNIQYIGETLWPGQIGHFLIVLSFVSILFSMFSYWKDTRESTTDIPFKWKTLGKIGFITHSLSVYGIIGILFYVMTHLMYEYGYVYEHCSDDLPMRYIFSAFWEGQEGSFLLWMFWHSILGLIIIFKGGKWESPVIMFLAIIQAIIASMLLGLHVGFGEWIYKLGSNPTLLLREAFNAPIFQQADYLASIKGDGLNPLLQNYWMTIHPPTLFLGFASVTIPFAFAASGLYMKDYKSWLTPCLKWSLFSAAILGTGILMGAAWAYEALTFGGYWAWDPVENMSLVPWIVLLAGIHTNVIARNTGRAIKSTYIYYSLAFVMILYSTYLTRSGILGDTSAHAFTEMGLEPQLIFLVLFPMLLSLALYFKRASFVPIIKSEESIYSREFWMFVGALVLLFSALIISTSTSLPVFNAIVGIFNPGFEGTVIKDPIPHFNKFQIWVAVLITVMTAKTIHLRYKAEDWSANQIKKYLFQNIKYFLIAGALTYATSLWIDFYHWKFVILTLACFFTIISNGHFLFKNLSGNLKLAGAVVSHVGFGIMVIGTISTGLNSSKITNMPFVMQELVNEGDEANVVDLIQGIPFFTEGYWVTYESDTIVDRMRTFKLKFEKEKIGQEGESKEITETFYVYPNILFTNDLTKVAATNPDTKHYIDKDIFVNVAALPPSQIDIELAKAEEDSLVYVTHARNIGDTIVVGGSYGILEKLIFNPENVDYVKGKNDLGLGVRIRFINEEKEINKVIEPVMALKENLLYHFPQIVNDLKIKVKLNDSTFENYFSQEEKLTYITYDTKQEVAFDFNGYECSILGFEKDVVNPNYDPEPSDIAVMAIIQIKGNGFSKILKPVYVIRNNRPFSIKDYLPEEGLHVRLSHIDPVNEKFIVQIAQDKRINKEIVLDIAENVPRTDYIAIEATVFPGINLFWLGSLFMMIGLLVAFAQRLKIKNV